MNNYPQVVKDIHNEFNIAGERLLQESLAILKQEEKKDLRKGELLNSAGFINSVQSGEFAKSIEVSENARFVASIVTKYKQMFPCHKFIKNDDVLKINKKYNLNIAETEDFIGFVPQKNLDDIHSFKNNHKLVNKRYFIESIDIFKMALWISFAKNKFQNYLKSINYTVVAESKRHAESLVYGICAKFSNTSHNSEYISIHGITFSEKGPFVICAPNKDFKKQTVFQQLLNPVATKFNTVPDPIVLYPVEHGYIIVTAWGDEASDPLVINENNN